MATSTQLTDLAADVLGLSPVLVASYYRYLREADLVTRGGRGRHGPKMTSHDAAALLTACCGAGMVREYNAADVVSNFNMTEAAHIARRHCLPVPGKPGWIDGDFTYNDAAKWEFQGLAVPSLQALPARHRLIDALAALIDAEMKHELALAEHVDHPGVRPTCITEICFYGPEPRADIKVELMAAGAFSYEEEAAFLLPQRIDQNPLRGYRAIDDEIDRQYGVGDLEIRRKITNRTIMEIAALLADQKMETES